MKIIIHGGLSKESHASQEIKEAMQESLKRIVLDSYEYLKTHNAMEAVIHAVTQLEDDPLYDAGIGAMLQSDGIIRMSAALMDGISQKLSGVINIEDVKNPIQVAEKLMPYDDRVLGGEGAIKFARENGFEEFSTETPFRRQEYLDKVASQGTGTVGCVVLDANGNLAVGTSTGGKGFEMPGRISDSPTVAGTYANENCAVSCTGVGEDIVSGAVAAKIVTRVTDGFSIQNAFEKTFDEVKTFNGYVGAIGIDRLGNVFWQQAAPTIVYAIFDGENLEVFK